MKSKTIGIFLILIIIMYTVRVIYVNKHCIEPELIKYRIGEEVSIEDDYFDNSSEKMNGYTVTVLGTEVIPMDEFKKKYNNYVNETFSEYMYLVNVRFKNINNQYGNNAGIDLGQYILQETSYINYIDQEAYELINDFDSIQFSLRMNSEMEFILPFQIDSFFIDKNQLKKGNPQLVISLYPHKKVVELKE